MHQRGKVSEIGTTECDSRAKKGKKCWKEQEEIGVRWLQPEEWGALSSQNHN